jgi:hypothetical protein
LKSPSSGRQEQIYSCCDNPLLRGHHGIRHGHVLEVTTGIRACSEGFGCDINVERESTSITWFDLHYLLVSNPRFCERGRRCGYNTARTPALECSTSIHSTRTNCSTPLVSDNRTRKYPDTSACATSIKRPESSFPHRANDDARMHCEQ